MLSLSLSNTKLRSGPSQFLRRRARGGVPALQVLARQSRKTPLARSWCATLGFSSAKCLKSRETKRGALEKVCRRRTAKSTRKIVAQPGFEGQVRAELMNLDILQMQRREFGRESEGNTIFARDFGRVEEEKFVDDACCERGAVERWAGF